MIWIQATANATFGGKTSFGATVFNDKMCVIGGNDENFDPTNDQWHSQDGTIWTPSILTANFSKRVGHTAVTFDD